MNGTQRYIPHHREAYGHGLRCRHCPTQEMEERHWPLLPPHLADRDKSTHLCRHFLPTDQHLPPHRGAFDANISNLICKVERGGGGSEYTKTNTKLILNQAAPHLDLVCYDGLAPVMYCTVLVLVLVATTHTQVCPIHPSVRLASNRQLCPSPRTCRCVFLPTPLGYQQVHPSAATTILLPSLPS